MAAVVISSTSLTLVMAAPFINMLALLDNAKWLAAYILILCLGAAASCLAIGMAIGLFRLLGPRRTRFVSQVASAVVGAAFVIGIQAAAILSAGTFSRLSFLQSDSIATWAPAPSSLIWWPARAAMGESVWLLPALILVMLVLALVIIAASGNFASYVIAASGVDFAKSRTLRSAQKFRQRSVHRVLLHKEWTLLARDPWLVSQTLMQILYLVPPALLLWRYYGDRAGVLLVLVPVLVMAAGQLAGGLAWLAVSGEDAPDLIGSAPVSARAVLWAKIEAVLIAVVIMAAPIIVALAIVVPLYGLVAFGGVAIAAVSGTAIQIWFRRQARRTHFRRRHTSSRIATLAEALVSILWAGAAAIAAAGSWLALMPSFAALIVLSCVYAIRPRRTANI